MIVALTYIGTSLALTTIFLVLGLIKNKPRGVVGFYFYPKKYVWLVFSGLPTLLFVGAVIILVSPESSWRYPTIGAAIGVLFIGSYSILYLHIRSYYVKVEAGAIVFGSLFFIRQFNLRDVRRFVVLEGGRGGQFLELYDVTNRMLFSAADTIQDFPDLMAQVRRQLSISTVSFESRDKWGTWTRRGAS